MTDRDRETLEEAVFALCRTVTGGREHLDVIQCLAGIGAECLHLEEGHAKTLAWAVLCNDGSVHEGEEHCFLFLADDQARDEAEILDDDPEWHDCGPHRVEALKGKGER